MVAQAWKDPRLGSPIYIFTVGLQNLFGMPKSALRPYKADDSGSRSRPHPESDIAPHNRVDYLTHVDLYRAFGGSALNKKFLRCADLLKLNLDGLALPKDEWTEIPDFLVFFQDQVGTALIKGIYGPTLLELNPGFMDDIWLFDRATPYFIKLMPRFLSPKIYQVRARLLQAIQRWYIHARKHFRERDIGPDGDYDPYWGSELIRSRQRVLLKADDQDDTAMAAADLGLIWT